MLVYYSSNPRIKERSDPNGNRIRNHHEHSAIYNAGETHVYQIFTPSFVTPLYNVGGGGTRWRSWLRHCATSRKVEGSIPDGAIGIFHWHNPSDRTMALGLTQPLIEMSTRSISWGVKAAGA